MGAMSSHHVEDASDSSKPIIEDIVELCAYCVKLTERMSENSPYDRTTVSSSWGFDPTITPGMCRFCEVISNYPWIRDMGVTTEFISDRDMGRRWNPKGPGYIRICATHVANCTFAIWADPGKKLQM